MWRGSWDAMGVTYTGTYTAVTGQVWVGTVTVVSAVTGECVWTGAWHSLAISPDGSDLIGQVGGGGVGAAGNTSLVTAYGVWTLGSVQAPQPGYGGGTFCEVMLNGKPFCPAAPIGIFGFPPMQQLRVAYDGNIYGINFDQLWNQVTNYSWQGSDGDLASGPLGTPVYPGALPVFRPSYALSVENTSISGGTGSLQTVDGVFDFGVVNGVGWDLRLNGTPLELGWHDPTHYAVDLATVYGVGQLFFRTTDAVWHLWAGYQSNPSTGPTALPVPISSAMSPSRPTLSRTVPIGTHVADLTVVMSDGSGFLGDLSLNDSTYYAISGSAIVTNAAPMIGQQLMLTCSQNGNSFQRVIATTVT